MIHPTAIIDTKSKISENVYIGPYCTIGPEVEIGSYSKLHSHISIKGSTKIGKNNEIFPFVSIGTSPQDLKYKGEKNSIIIGDNNKLREYVNINPGTSQGGTITKIGNNNLLLAYSHVAHDCEIADNVVLTNQAALAGAVKVGEGAILGGYAIVHQYCSIGAYSFCAMGSAVNKDVPAFVRVRGNPAGVNGINSIGLRRQGFSKSAIESLKSAYRSVYRKNLTVEEALKEIRPLATKHKEVKLFTSTIKKSTRGIAR